MGVLLLRFILGLGAAAGGALLALVLAKVAVGYVPAAEPTLFSWDAYPFVERWWYEVPALTLLGSGLWVARTSVIKRDLVLIVGGLLLARIALVAALGATGRDGTTDAGIARGLKRKLPGRTVRVTAPRSEDLQAPALVSILLPGRIGHAVLLEEATADGVRLADPGRGRWTAARSDFEARWQGSPIRVR